MPDIALSTLETIHILRQHDFGIFWTYTVHVIMYPSTFVSIGSTENQQKITIFLTPPIHLFADVIYG